MHEQPKGDISTLAFAAITQRWPKPPPHEDNPPLHAFTMAIGFLAGRLMEKAVADNEPNGLVLCTAMDQALHRIAGKKSVQEVVELIWGEQHAA